ncbi:MFS transporter [Acrocarpospora sp. B8E8]|uniref:MFS transporter n=1 Tax=Acrocarpospora sp. B8E8 TaxID=3153572 RepID=UPI00325DCD36
MRSAAFAAVCVLLAAVAHRLAGGDGPTAPALAVAAAGVFAGSAMLAGRERSPVLITSVLLVAQGGLHELFNHGATVKAILTSRLASVPAAPVADHQTHGLGISLGMLIAHLTAALVTAWWVGRGEAALWSVLRRMGIAAVRVLLRLFAPVDATGLVALRRVAHGWHHLGLPRTNEPLRYIVVRRGPPLPV